jgi:hypothetical protein
LSVNPQLTWREVRDVIAKSCRKIDCDSAVYDGRGHSEYYGYGCLDLPRAIQIALQKNSTAAV